MNYILPGLILLLILYGLIKGTDVYSAFVEGAMEALPLIAKILPSLGAMMAMIALFRGSGAMDFVIRLLSPICQQIGMPEELLPLFVLRPFSGNGALALLQDVYNTCGVDSLQGFAASVMLGSTETIFFTVTLYFGSIGIKKTKYAIPAALLSGIIGAVVSIVFAYLAVV